MSVANGIYWIECGGTRRLAIIRRPRGGDQLRDEIGELAKAGFGIVVSLLTQAESVDLDLQQEKDCCSNAAIAFHNLPIQDRAIPESRFKVSQLVVLLAAAIAEGKVIGVHCRIGIGRSALLCACILIAQGVEPRAAIDQISRAREAKVPDTEEQVNWILSFPEALSAPEQNRAFNFD